MKGSTDARLLFQQLQTASGEAVLLELHHLHFSRASKLIHSLVKQREPAEELVSNIFAQLWQRRQKLPEVINPEVYLYVIAPNKAVSFLKQRMHFTSTIQLTTGKDPERVIFCGHGRKLPSTRNTTCTPRPLQRKEHNTTKPYRHNILHLTAPAAALMKRTTSVYSTVQKPSENNAYDPWLTALATHYNNVIGADYTDVLTFKSDDFTLDVVRNVGVKAPRSWKRIPGKGFKYRLPW